MSISNGEIAIRVLDGPNLMAELETVAARVAEVATDGFGPDKIMSAERMATRLSHEPSIVLAEEGGQLVGFQLQSVHDLPPEHFLYYAHAVRRNEQGRGLGSRLLNTAIDHYQPTLLGARSQNPAAILSFTRVMERRGVELIYPFAHGPEADELRSVLPAFLGALGFSEAVDPSTGLSRGVFAEGRLGNYEVRTGNPDIAKLERHFLSAGLDREAGDAIFYFARLVPSLP